jgi:putative zinc finger/helix-turn-helix YgiT family protein
MKPFPRKCQNCLAQALSPAVIDYTTEAEHDGRLYSVHLDSLEVLRCGNCGLIVLTDDANRRISEALREQAGLLSPSAIQAQRESLGLSYGQLAEFLDVDEETLMRWESGGQIQQRAMDKLLRLFFEVPECRVHLSASRNGAALTSRK